MNMSTGSALIQIKRPNFPLKYLTKVYAPLSSVKNVNVMITLHCKHPLMFRVFSSNKLSCWKACCFEPLIDSCQTFPRLQLI